MIPEFDMSDEKIIDTNKIVDELRQIDLPIFIWGYAVTAAVLKEKLTSRGIKISGFVTDKPGIKNTINVGKARASEVIYKDDLIARYPKYVLIKGFAESFNFADSEILAAWNGCNKVYAITDDHDDIYFEKISREFYIEHKAAFDEVYDNLADNFSRDSLRAYLMCRILKNPVHLAPYVISPPYFFTPALYTLTGEDILLDGGAFNGDSALDFVKFSGGNYKSIITCEPDPSNHESLKANLTANGVKNLVALNVGLSNEKGTLKFKSNMGMSGDFSTSGDVEIPIDTIDNITLNGGGIMFLL